ncbi:hypothetical protein H6F51_24835 [Cyanobacteria bacterium FACHB-DQ100]|uniref:hypothetical protein n=1 Tax=Leptolyngbya sp. DQ-M1 TaxID=2933920 RepID=UPI0019A4A202|nr:hypothetical protein [Cyanobacteria bacterium FACHB-DQ100]
MCQSWIALTAYAGEIDQQQVLQAGFQRHMTKPVEQEELVRAVSTFYNSEETAALVNRG